MPRLIKVVGDSMSPTFIDGDYVLTVKPRSLRLGLNYVIKHSDLGLIIKRLERIDNGRCFFVGNNPKSTPSAVIGPVEKSRIIGRVVFKI